MRQQLDRDRRKGTVDLIVVLNRAVASQIEYTSRMESGVLAPDDIFSKKRDAFARSKAEYDLVRALPDSVIAKPLAVSWWPLCGPVPGCLAATIETRSRPPPRMCAKYVTSSRYPSKPDMSCEEKRRLMLAYNQATKAFSAAVDALNENVALLPKEEYDKLRLAAESAQEKAREARLALDSHIAQHRC